MVIDCYLICWKHVETFSRVLSIFELCKHLFDHYNCLSLVSFFFSYPVLFMIDQIAVSVVTPTNTTCSLLFQLNAIWLRRQHFTPSSQFQFLKTITCLDLLWMAPLKSAAPPDLDDQILTSDAGSFPGLVLSQRRMYDYYFFGLDKNIVDIRWKGFLFFLVGGSVGNCYSWFFYIYKPFDVSGYWCTLFWVRMYNDWFVQPVNTGNSFN